MTMLELIDRGGYRAFDEARCIAAGEAFATRYRDADPFPHVVIDDFVDAALLRRIASDFPETDGATARAFDRPQERLKRQVHPQAIASLPARNLFAELNSQAFLSFLSALTGIEGLIADPYFIGAGLHETRTGGYLGIHADFNRHDRIKLERRLNLLIYLNDDWEGDWGGALELWDRPMTTCRVRADPVMARAVIFSTDLDSFHGHPDPLRCPPDRSRRSIATYYYTTPRDDALGIDRTTNFRQRAGSGDRRDWRVTLHHLFNDWAPPRLRRHIRFL
jgi:Rps23 Pro-64 3,4-dihydroxylase Tpa1-like proline 4-hydroxylase